ncbi:MAG: exodeoxyribonuclease VII large subunit [Alphaproteobacteria bacterium]|nr:exodeoxyribonuclease VII large subunit [Alphaproteobacteria bacterium]
METTEKPILSVTEISLSLKSCVEQIFSDIRVRGEVIGVKKAPSGHTYFSLKDSDSVLSAVCWRGRDKTTTDSLTDGLEIVCTGKLSTYPGRSNYQMIVEKAEPAGIGALLKLLNDRKIKLEKEGLFEISRKKQIPYLPDIIGVVTSPTGAVIRDIMHRLNERFPRHVLLWPVLVQGEGAAEQITTAINGFNAIPQEGIHTPTGFIPRPDLLIVARGGGSFEDLWCFNEENVVRAAAASQIPLISAVGHETDTTLIDYAADLRAPTPTGAAEKAVPVHAELSAYVSEAQERLIDGLYRLLENAQNKLETYSRAMPKLSDIIQSFFEKLEDRSERLKNSINYYMKSTGNQLDMQSKLLQSYSFNAVLERGFTLILNNNKQILSSKSIAEQEENLNIRFCDGTLTVYTTNIYQPTSEKKLTSFKNKNSSPFRKQNNMHQPDLFFQEDSITTK